jgi:hypothetical protein
MTCSSIAGAGAALAILLSVASARAHAPEGRYGVVAGGVLDTKTHLTWQNPAPIQASWDYGHAYCGTLGSGWRLPTIKELETLVDYSVVGAPTADPIFADTQPLQYWSSTPMRTSTDYAWTVDFKYGSTVRDQRTNVHFIRCVR